MTAETVSAIASIGTFLVILVTAIAALIQLRHIRSANQLTGLLHATARWESEVLQSAGSFIQTQLAARLKDPEFRAGLWARSPDRRLHPELHVADWCEQLGSYIKYGMISQEQYLDLGGLYVDVMWEHLREVVAICRAASQTSAKFENFEYLAACSRIWRAKHAKGNYPRSVARLMPEEEWTSLVDPRKQ